MALSPAGPAAVPAGFRWGDRTLVMGVLNLTPDSFSDGGRYEAPDAALRQARVLHRQGADLLDLGGQSTRPGASEIDAEAEIARVVPALRRILASLPPPDAGGPLLSIDTFREALGAIEALEGVEAVAACLRTL
ncbi:dihydropteroate synthase [Synechococcus sp. BA-120 BA3]|nr:dihydropteroate synthase [Synechococcus sp. BA-120 BA3]